MKAAILTELNKDLEIRDDVTLGDIGPGDVHVKIAASGVCHSDVSAQNGTIPCGCPTVLGHEGAGVVAEIGEGVTSVAVGDHVVTLFSPECGECVHCKSGKTNICLAIRVVGILGEIAHSRICLFLTAPTLAPALGTGVLRLMYLILVCKAYHR